MTCCPWKMVAFPLLLAIGLALPFDIAGFEDDEADDDASAPSKSTQAADSVVGVAVATPAQEAMLEVWHKNIAEWKEKWASDTADNSFCYVCHANYRGEALVKVHEPKGVGCETCHGISDKHSEDEDSLVPPDVLFPTASIARFCLQCHKKDELIDADEKHAKFFANQIDSKKSCTDCHDIKHNLKVRTRRWNKVTRKLDWYDGVRMMQERNEDKDKK